jgi:hypothetical protein
LTVSAFAWAHEAASRANTCIVGAAITWAAVYGLKSTVVWRLNTGFAVWLAFSTLVLYPARPITLWNNLSIALALSILVLLPDRTIGPPD